MATSMFKNGNAKFSIEDLVGKNVFIRTVTHYFIGELVGMDAQCFYITQAAWVAETARWSETVSKGTLNEVEPYPTDLMVCVSRAAFIDIFEWFGDLNIEVKS
jgi:hypothetical protein